MRAIKRIFMIPMAVVALLAASCTGNSVDDASSADVFLAILSMTNPAVTAQVSTGMSGACSISSTACVGNSDCPSTETCVIPPAGCTLTVSDWNAQLENHPKNALASNSPLNDIVMIDLTIAYTWLNGAVTPTRTVGLGGVSVPVGGSNSMIFQPIAINDLNSGLEGSTADLTMTFRGETVEGTTVVRTVTRQLNVEVCM